MNTLEHMKDLDKLNDHDRKVALGALKMASSMIHCWADNDALETSGDEYRRGQHRGYADCSNWLKRWCKKIRGDKGDAVES